MGKTIVSFFIATIILFSCEKEEYTKYDICTPLEMTGSRSNVIGTWKWFSTSVKIQYDPNSTPQYEEITPQTEGFEYYFTIDANGSYKGYKNNVLVHSHVFSDVKYEVDNQTITGLEPYLDCTNEYISLAIWYSAFDTLKTETYPYIGNEYLGNYRWATSSFFARQ